MTLMIINICCLVFGVVAISDTKSWGVNGNQQVPCFFVFGDSLSDPGNNNNLRTIAKANYPPYGIDFPTGVATGRFTNGRIMVDVLAELLGFKDFIPRFINVPNKKILKGVNYASGAAGIRQETGVTQGARFSMNAQLLNHIKIVKRIRFILKGKNNTYTYLNKCLYTVGFGSNDYVNNYFMPESYSSSRRYTPEQYANVLIQQYGRQLKSLYNQGARKVALIGLGQIGFTPVELATFGSGAHPTPFDINDAVALFNTRLRNLVDKLNANLTNAKFTFLNTTAVATTGDPQTLGLTVLSTPCCKVGKSNFTCEPSTQPCVDRNRYAFYDNIHSSERVNVLFGNTYFNAPIKDFVHPYDISTLARL